MIKVECNIRKREGKLFYSFFEYNQNDEKVSQLLLRNNFKKIYKTFYENGLLKSCVSFLNDKKHGLYKYYYPNGNIKISIPYRFHKIHGTIKYYNNEGELNIKSSYKEGIKNGTTIHYNSKKEPVIIKMFRDNKLHGKVILKSNFFYSIIQYREGKKQGKEKNYIIDLNEKKKLYSIISYKDNYREGNTIFFNQDEKIVTIIPFRNNKIHGYKRSYNEDGSIKERIHYREGNQIYHFLKLFKEKECSVCYENTLTQTKCKHILCNSCYERLVHKNCPLCRIRLF